MRTRRPLYAQRPQRSKQKALTLLTARGPSHCCDSARPPPCPFRTQGAGAGALRRDHLGGDVAVSLTAALNFQFPRVPGLASLRVAGLHGHVFVNGGSVALLGGGARSLRAGADELLSSFRWASVRPAHLTD